VIFSRQRSVVGTKVGPLPSHTTHQSAEEGYPAKESMFVSWWLRCRCRMWKMCFSSEGCVAYARMCECKGLTCHLCVLLSEDISKKTTPARGMADTVYIFCCTTFRWEVVLYDMRDEDRKVSFSNQAFTVSTTTTSDLARCCQTCGPPLLYPS